MIYARIDVNIIHHEKALNAGVEAFGLWCWGMCYAQIHETDGRLPRVAVMSAFGAERRVLRRSAVRLVTAGLWEELKCGSFQVHNYGNKNQTAEEISKRKLARLQSNAERQKAWRDRRVTPRNAEPVPLLVTEVTGLTPEPEPTIEPTPSPVLRPAIDLEVVGTEEPTEKPSTLRYREAYCDGIQRAKGSPYAWPSGPQAGYADQDLGLAIATFAKSRSTGKALRGEDLLGWIRAAAEDFVNHVAETKDQPKFWSNFAPKGLVRFLNQDTMAAEARNVG